MREEPLTPAELERLATLAEGYTTLPGVAYSFWFATLARVCRHALALEVEVARLRRQESARRAMRHEVHEDDGEA